MHRHLTRLRDALTMSADTRAAAPRMMERDMSAALVTAGEAL